MTASQPDYLSAMLCIVFSSAGWLVDLNGWVDMAYENLCSDNKMLPVKTKMLKRIFIKFYRKGGIYFKATKTKQSAA